MYDSIAHEALIEKILRLAELTRSEGLNALEAEAKKINSLFFKTGLMLVVDGTEPTIIREVMQNLIEADELSPQELTSRKIVMQGIISIKRGDASQTISLLLNSMLGESYIPLYYNVGVPAIMAEAGADKSQEELDEEYLLQSLQLLQGDGQVSDQEGVLTQAQIDAIVAGMLDS